MHVKQVSFEALTKFVEQKKKKKKRAWVCTSSEHAWCNGIRPMESLAFFWSGCFETIASTDLEKKKKTAVYLFTKIQDQSISSSQETDITPPPSPFKNREQG